MAAKLTNTRSGFWGLPWDESFFRFRVIKRSRCNGIVKESGKQEVLVVASRKFQRGLIRVLAPRRVSGRGFLRPA